MDECFEDKVLSRVLSMDSSFNLMAPLLSVPQQPYMGLTVRVLLVATQSIDGTWGVAAGVITGAAPDVVL